MKNGKHLCSIDMLKSMAAILTFFFHCQIHLSVQFRWLTPFISQGAIVMDLFFILSGYTLYAKYSMQPFEPSAYLKFYGRRLYSIYPMYALIMLAFWIVPAWRLPVKDVFISLPVELLLLQSWFPGMFSVGHNGGTWFLSCIMSCYIVFPLLLTVCRQMQKRALRLVTATCYILCSVIPIMTIHFAIVTAYSNPLIRMLQFFSGMMLAKQIDSEDAHRATSYNFQFAFWLAIISGIVLCVAVTWLWEIEYLRWSYIGYGFVTFPLFLLMIKGFVTAEREYNRDIKSKRLWHILGNHSYAIFMAQFFVLQPVREIKAKFPWYFTFHGNIKTFALATMMCTVVAIVLQNCFNAPVQRFIKNMTEKERINAMVD